MENLKDKASSYAQDLGETFAELTKSVSERETINVDDIRYLESVMEHFAEELYRKYNLIAAQILKDRKDIIEGVLDTIEDLTGIKYEEDKITFNTSREGEFSFRNGEEFMAKVLKNIYSSTECPIIVKVESDYSWLKIEFTELPETINGPRPR